MKMIKTKILFFIVFWGCLSCSKPDSANKTIIKGIVTADDGSPVKDAKLTFYKSVGGFMNWSPSYEVVDSTRSQSDGSYYIEVQDGADAISVHKTGFFYIQKEKQPINYYTQNTQNFILDRGCKVTFYLKNPNNYQGICIDVPSPCHCDFPYSSECFFNKAEQETSCYLLGGDTAIIEYHYVKDHNHSITKSLKLWCPKGGTEELTIIYN